MTEILRGLETSESEGIGDFLELKKSRLSVPRANGLNKQKPGSEGVPAPVLTGNVSSGARNWRMGDGESYSRSQIRVKT